MKLKATVILLAALIPSISFASNIKTGETLPGVTVTNKGELVLKGKTISYQSWRSTKLTGKMRILFAIAGRSSAKDLNAPLITAISAANFPENKYQTTTIINQSDAIWGTGGFVKSATEDSKREYPWSSIVLDTNGIVQKSWDLKKESSAVFVINKAGQVIFAKEGKLSTNEINTVILLVKNNL
ncbi:MULTISPECIES: YtfJ family protein [unclassified Photobacterium]|uniref:YtfJ family protein n=1 Tax=unclassified Photobacterium TaxID=2628852 RepID=UPI001EDE518E|nr:MULTISPECIES: YtfJ family protein [unclassified Photobacterium]MCG3864937.1 YtfJ family protein [Photobacterium sp. Ph6]MCG3876391.1 YtfJ family protein [Photobacterium sp. Ph5]